MLPCVFIKSKGEEMRRGSPPAPAIPMSERQYKLLSKERSKRTISRQNYMRITILLRASQGEANKQIVREESVALSTVKNWRSRWNSVVEQLQEFEEGLSGEGVSDFELLEKMLEVIKDRPRSGVPVRISVSQKQQIRALACEAPKDYGLVMTDWTRQRLADTAVKQGIVEQISVTHIGTILKKRPTPTAQIGILVISQNSELESLCTTSCFDLSIDSGSY
jgi:transposase